jgi:sugar/nucleoside kinase (ribokinase family)
VRYDVLILGDYFYDLIFSGLSQLPALGEERFSRDLVTTGGATYITVCALHRLGVRVGWRGHFGSDMYSVAIIELAQREGIDLSLARVADAPYRRVTTALPLHGERAFATYVDPEPADLHAFWLEALHTADYRHVHLGGALPLKQLAPLAAAAHRRGATVSMDCQDVALLYSDCQWQEMLALVDVFMPNAREARLITGLDHVEEAAQRLLDWTKCVVIKDGASGAVIGGGGRVQRVAGIDAGVCVDTTGAGDCFNAGFLYGMICEGAPLERCALYGNICGGLSVTGEGGATHAPDLATLRAWAGKHAV